MDAKYSRFTQHIHESLEDIQALFGAVTGWENKYRQIMLLGKRLPPLIEQDKTDRHLIKGCESKVWLHWHLVTDEQGQDRYHFAADSDARIVKGLVIIILVAFNGRRAAQITSFDIDGYFNQLGLLKHLSPSRSNGIHAIVNTILSVVDTRHP